MFEKLGFNKTFYIIGFSYEMKNKPFKMINFYIDDMSFFASSRITMEEFKAITQQMKELGWIE